MREQGSSRQLVRPPRSGEIRAHLPRAARGTGAFDVPAPVLRIDPLPAPVGDGMWREERASRRWRRRLITVPALLAATAVLTGLLPVLLLYAVVSDLLHRRPMLLCRFYLTIASVFWLHCLGLLLLALWWLGGKARRYGQDAWRTSHARLEAWWSDKLIGVARLFYGLRVVSEDDGVARGGPYLMLMRHASIVDTMMPMGHFYRHTGVIMRTVKKHELLWDPCVDFISHRLPRAFVKRGSGNAERQAEVLRRLTAGMGPNDAVAMFPEGTRYTVGKQSEVVAKLTARDPVAAERAKELANLLPIRPTGTDAILDARPELDIVFCAHTGLEGAGKLEDFVRGSLLGRTLKIKVWRVPRSEVPVDPHARTLWLHAWWRTVDRWITDNRQD